MKPKYVIHDKLGKGAPHKENMINPETGEVLSFPTRLDIAEYCEGHNCDYYKVEIQNTRTNDPDYISLKRVEIVKDDLLSKDDLLNYASNYLWSCLESHYKHVYNAIMKRPDKRRFLKFIFFAFGREDLIQILKNRIDHHDFDPIRGIYNDVKPGIEKICDFKLHFETVNMLITKPRTTKIKTNKKLAIYGYIKKYHQANFKSIHHDYAVECDELIQEYFVKHKIP